MGMMGVVLGLKPLDSVDLADKAGVSRGAESSVDSFGGGGSAVGPNFTVRKSITSRFSNFSCTLKSFWI